MNKTRRMVTETAMRLNEAGVAVINPDLFGTGDSEGDLVGATWGKWIDDLRFVDGWAREQELDIQAILAVRSGCLLAADFATRAAPVRATTFWQPVREGKVFINQLLRLRVVASSVNRGIRETAGALRDLARRAGAIELGGYEIPCDLLSAFDAAALEDLVTPRLGLLSIVDISRVVTAVTVEEVSFGQSRAQVTTMSGEPYWASVETVVDRRVVDLTVQHFLERIQSV